MPSPEFRTSLNKDAGRVFDPPPSSGPTTLNVSLFPYTPEPAWFVSAVRDAWAKVEPGITLKFCDCILAASSLGQTPQYLVPTRRTPMAQLRRRNPHYGVYHYMSQIIAGDNARAFRLGMDSLTWLDDTKSCIRSAIVGPAPTDAEARPIEDGIRRDPAYLEMMGVVAPTANGMLYANHLQGSCPAASLRPDSTGHATNTTSRVVL